MYRSHTVPQRGTVLGFEVGGDSIPRPVYMLVNSLPYCALLGQVHGASVEVVRVHQSGSRTLTTGRARDGRIKADE